MTNRLIAIGDIHGHPATLSALLEQIQVQPTDEFIFLGDYIDRGPNSPGVIDLCIKLAQTNLSHFIFGNHEEAALAARLGKSDLHFWMVCGGKTTIKDYGFNPALVTPQDLHTIPDQHQRFYGNLLDYYETDTHIFVHANYDPNKPLSKTNSESLRWKSLDTPTAPHHSGKTVVCGHTPGPIRDWGHLICIDTGCGKGGKLTALEVHTGQTWQINQIN